MATDAELKKKRHDAAIKGAETRRNNQAAKSTRSTTSNTRRNRRFPWWGYLLIGLGILGLSLLIFRPQATQTIGIIPLNPTETTVQEPTVAPTVAPTEAPVVPTEAPVVATKPAAAAIPADVACSISASTDGGKTWLTVGENLGNRLAITNGIILYGHTAPYDKTELPMVEQTWIDYRIISCEGTFPVVFAGGFKTNDVTYNDGVILYLGDLREFSLRNGELVVWTDFNGMHADVANRIPTQIINGNVDFPSQRLAFRQITAEFLGYIPEKLRDQAEIVTLR